MPNKPKHPGGRPSKYKPEYCDMIVEHMKDGASMVSFASEIGVARCTLDQWAKDHPEFSGAIKIGKSACAAWWEKAARANAKDGGGNAALCIFGLKNMAPDEWREKQEIAHTSPDGSMSPKPTIDVTKLTTEQLKAIKAATNADNE